MGEILYTLQEVMEAEDARLERLRRQYQVARELSRVEDTEHVVLVSGSMRHAWCVREIHAAIFCWG